MNFRTAIALSGILFTTALPIVANAQSGGTRDRTERRNDDRKRTEERRKQDRLNESKSQDSRDYNRSNNDRQNGNNWDRRNDDRRRDNDRWDNDRRDRERRENEQRDRERRDRERRERERRENDRRWDNRRDNDRRWDNDRRDNDRRDDRWGNGGWNNDRRDNDRWDDRQDSKNEWRNIAMGAGALGVIGLLNKDNTLTFAGALGALYSLQRYEQDRRSQNSYDRARSRYFDNEYFTRDGVRYNRRTVTRNGERFYQFERGR